MVVASTWQVADVSWRYSSCIVTLGMDPGMSAQTNMASGIQYRWGALTIDAHSYQIFISFRIMQSMQSDVVGRGGFVRGFGAWKGEIKLLMVNRRWLMAGTESGRSAGNRMTACCSLRGAGFFDILAGCGWVEQTRCFRTGTGRKAPIMSDRAIGSGGALLSAQASEGRKE
jgi:hypothetical protein